jgi:D-alanyl-lipoteichoic acid acyltransferase DltB (MBOAT superfamily)
MLFNSYEFIFGFLPVAFVGFFVLARVGVFYAALWLGFASVIFYGYWNPRFVLLLLGSIAFNYAAGYLIAHTRGLARIAVTSFAIAANLLVLAYFKYANFFLSALNDISGSHWGALSIILPLGISFFTFTQIAFLVDVHRNIAREYNPTHYLLFVTFFPHLIAGPLLHHKQMMPQFAEPATYKVNWQNIAAGLIIFSIGLAKKVLIADNLAPTADRIFASAHNGVAVTFFDAWAGTLAYTFQLYFDFSGYSDMAIGLALLFNIRLPLNFDAPYRSLSIADFWKRWHISLSTFLRDYLYIPLGGNRKGEPRRYLNLLITMVLGGLWHGANWTFVIWGTLHGVFLSLNYLWRSIKERLGLKPGTSRLSAFGAWSLTFLCVCIAWVFFRAETVADARSILSGMAGLNGFSLPTNLASLGVFKSLAQTFSIPLFEDGLVPLLDSGGKLYREFRTVIIVAAIIAFFVPAIDIVSKIFLQGDDSAERRKWILNGPWTSPRFYSNRYLAVVFGILLGITLAYIQRETPFLYFQF